MRRAVTVSLKFATVSKRRRLSALLEAYRSAVNFYIVSLWEVRGGLNKETLSRLPDNKTRLSARYKSQALKQALEVITSTKKSAKALGKPCTRPVFTGPAILDAKFVTISTTKTPSFDLFVTISSLQKGNRITIPTKGTAVLNKWLSKPGATLIQGAALSESKLVLWVSLPDFIKNNGLSLGVDIGVNKLISLSNGQHLGVEFKELRNKVVNKLCGSKSKRRILLERDQFIRRQVNLLPWANLRLIAAEDLKNLKTGKTKSRGKTFRKAVAPWSYRQVIEAIRQKAQEHGVHLVLVPPAYTSRTCPQCGVESRDNRKGEAFCCTACHYSADADTVGAINVLNKALRLVGSLESPTLTTS
jgi:IS605 OrfB family transposase